MTKKNLWFCHTAWEIIAEILDDGRKRQHSLQTIVNATFYVTKTGVQWRNLPKEFPKWQLVYYYFPKWSKAQIIVRIHQILYEQVRVKAGRSVSPSLGLLDLQSVKTASLTEIKGIDAKRENQWTEKVCGNGHIGLDNGINGSCGKRAGTRRSGEDICFDAKAHIRA